jgi:serine/threonine protein kinase
MSHIEIIEVHRYYPNGIRRIIGRGGESFIGVIDESTVLKYPCKPGITSNLQIESQLLDILGNHPRIIGSKGLTDDGLRLEYAVNGDLNSYITANPATSLDQRLRWCRQAAEAVEYLHKKRVIHCDINLRNLLLDENLDLKLADFQGMHKSCDGNVLLDGLSRECTKSFLPRVHGDYADVETDLFALGSAIYFIITGHEVFPDLDSDKDDEEIERRFRSGQFPVDPQVCNAITSKCWTQEYSSAQEVVDEIIVVQNNIASMLSCDNLRLAA